MIRSYIKQRSIIRIQIALSILLLFLIYDKAMDLVDLLNGFVFLIISLVVFRVIDDAGSVTLDRVNHPDRNYLSPSNYKSFLTITCLITGFFLVILFIIYSNVWWIIATLIFGSLLLYLLFHRSAPIMSIIPLLKYPTLLYCITLIAGTYSDITLTSSSFLIMLFYDVNDERNVDSLMLPNIIFALLIGLLVFQPWLNWHIIVFIIIPIVMVVLFSKSLYLKYLPIVYYPICSLLITLCT